MEPRKIGRSNIEIAPLVFGGNVFGWTVNEKTAFELLDRFLAAGFNCIDTADVYSTWVAGHRGGESETIIGHWPKTRGGRHKVVVATKVGAAMSDGGRGLSRAHIMKAAEASLRRLQTDYIDLYQSHVDDPAIAMEETLQAYADLIGQGKVRFIGASNYSAERLRQALETSRRVGLPRYESLQPMYNLYDHSAFEGELESTCAQQGIGVICYSALASGFLTGKYRSPADLTRSVRGDRVGTYLNPRGYAILQSLDTIAKRLAATPAQVALAWLLARPTITAPIASATTPQQLAGLCGAIAIRLDPEALTALNSAVAIEQT